MRIFLVGFMGSGKTTIGRQLAKAMGYRFVDTDSYIVDANNSSIHDLFEKEGEFRFREMEKEAIAEISKDDNVIIATGGGAPCFFDNMEFMNEAGDTVYLKLSPPGLMKRLERGRDRRPLLRGKNDVQLLEYIEVALAYRDEFYSRAKITVDCEGYSDCRIVELVKNAVSIQ